MSVLATFPETEPAMAALTRTAGMRGWEGELVRRAAGVGLEHAVEMLWWWPPDLVRTALATGRTRASHDGFLRDAAVAAATAAERVIGQLPHLDALVADLEWLVLRCEPGGRLQLQAALWRGFPSGLAARGHALATALDRFNDDCLRRAYERQGIDDPVIALVVEGQDPTVFGWSEADVIRARAAAVSVDSAVVRDDADALAAADRRAVLDVVARLVEALVVVFLFY